jgi:hypothetical protein
VQADRPSATTRAASEVVTSVAVRETTMDPSCRIPPAVADVSPTVTAGPRPNRIPHAAGSVTVWRR